jgi:hypothetical protein
MRLLDLFCGRWGWSRAFAARGWECWGIDLVSSPLPAANARFFCADILDVLTLENFRPDFIVASSPCGQFSVHGMKHFHPNPPYPELGIKLFNHTRQLCEASGVPYVMENVRAAQKFVGHAVHHCGSFYLWGNAVPPIMPQGILKGRRLMAGGYKGQTPSKSDKGAAAIIATIPIELANSVCDYAERILEEKAVAL